MTLLRDDLGTTHAVVTGDPRIISLVPSLTELLFDLGLGPFVVGRTQYCIRPRDQVDQVPSVGGTKRISMDRVRQLAATHAIVNVDENPKMMADELTSLGIDVIVTHPIEPTDNLRLYRLMGGIFRREQAAEVLARRFDAAYARLPATPARRQSVLYLIWRDPWMTVSRETYISRMLALIGWDTFPEQSSVRYPEASLPADLNQVSKVLLSTEPYPFTGHDVEAFSQKFPSHQRATFLIDGERVSWYGSRAIDGLNYLAHWAERGGPQ